MIRFSPPFRRAQRRLRVTALLFVGLLAADAWADPLLIIEGIGDELLDNVNTRLGYASESCASPEWRIQALFQRAPLRIREALEVYGYYNPVIESSLEVVADCQQARFVVTPGEPVRYSVVNVRVAGAEEEAPQWRDLLAANPMRPGEPLRHDVYESYKQRFINVARRFGYFDGAFVRSEVRVLADAGEAEVNLIYAPGTRYRFGETVIDQDVVADELVSRFIEYAPGDVFDSDRIADLYDGMLLTGYFAVTEIKTLPRTTGSHLVDVHIFATAAKASTYTAGLGFGTDTGPQVRLGYANRRRNEQGHQWGLNGNASRVIKQAGLSYRIPLNRPPAEWFVMEAGYKDEDTDSLISQQAKLGLKRLQRRPNDWLETQFLDVTNESFTVADSPGNIFYVAPGISWSRISTSGIARPKQGNRLSFQVSGTAEAIGSDLSFIQTVVSAKQIVSLPTDIRVLARLDIGATWVNAFQALPASLRFFAGGDFSVRGYDYKSLGPRDADGDVIGGKHQLTSSLEIERLLRPNWAIAAFIDAGNAFDSFGDMSLQIGVGGGIRWFSPVGPIRVDIAFPTSSQQSDDYRLHISLSPDL